MPEMRRIERVARAICVPQGINPDASTEGFPDWMYCEPEARAAIKAMRDATPAMIDAMRAADFTAIGPYPGWASAIDAALSEPERGE